jgi:predicted transcriptional regulator
MEKSIIKNLIDKGYSTWKISKTLNFSQTNIRYWLKKYKLKTNLTSKKDNNTEELFQVTDRKCPKCKEVKSVENFYNRRNGKGNSVYCKKCSNKEVTNRQRKFKEKCVAYKGGKCEICGYNKCVGALDFHHQDRSEKDFGIAQKKTYKYDSSIERELDKCMLLCSNCHRELHYNVNEK